MWRALRSRLIEPQQRRRADDTIVREQALTATLAHTSAERDKYLRERDEAIGERNAALVQRDQAIGERNAYLAQRDDAIGRSNQRAAELSAALDRQAHRFRCRLLRAERGRPLSCDAEGRLIVFSHLAKTGGVTLSQTLQRNVLSDAFPKIAMQPASVLGTWSASNVASALATFAESGRARLKAIWGHIPVGIKVPDDDPYRVTILREPVDRVLSQHFYLSRESRESLDVLLAQLEIALDDEGIAHVALFDNAQVRVLSGHDDLDPLEAAAARARRVNDDDLASAAAVLDRMAHVGVLHRYDEFVVVLAADLGWALADVTYRRANETKRRLAPHEIPVALRERIAALSRYDQVLVERAEHRLAARISAYPGRFEDDVAIFRRLLQMHQDGAAVEAIRATELAMLARAYGGS